MRDLIQAKLTNASGDISDAARSAARVPAFSKRFSVDAPEPKFARMTVPSASCIIQQDLTVLPKYQHSVWQNYYMISGCINTIDTKFANTDTHAYLPEVLSSEPGKT